MSDLVLISHHLCPYVQRAAIALTEKGIPFRRIHVDLANKPEWFTAVSPLGKTPVLKVGDSAIFESAVILEYLEGTQDNPLHPSDPLDRAMHRGWIEVSSSVLGAIAALYNAPDARAFETAASRISSILGRVDAALGDGPWFAGDRFSLVDASFGPVFRYFDVIGRIDGGATLSGLEKTNAWRQRLSARPSVRDAVTPDYPERLTRFLIGRGSHLSRLMSDAVDTV